MLSHGSAENEKTSLPLALPHILVQLLIKLLLRQFLDTFWHRRLRGSKLFHIYWNDSLLVPGANKSNNVAKWSSFSVLSARMLSHGSAENKEVMAGQTNIMAIPKSINIASCATSLRGYNLLDLLFVTECWEQSVERAERSTDKPASQQQPLHMLMPNDTNDRLPFDPFSTTNDKQMQSNNVKRAGMGIPCMMSALK